MKRDENLILRTSSDNFIKYIFYIAFYILIFICLFSVGYYLIYNTYVKKINMVDQEIMEIENFVNTSKSKRAIEYYSKMALISDIFKTRKSLTNIFSLIEKNTHYDVVFKEFEIVDNGEVYITGYCRTEEVCAQALLLFERMEESEYVSLDSIKKEGNTNLFKMYIKLNNF